MSFTFAEDGYDALRVLESQPDIDLVISDINMPRMNGLTLLSKLEEVLPLLKSVVVSAYGDMENIRNAMNRGAFDFVTKPIDFEDLERTIGKTLQAVDDLRSAYRGKAEAERAKAYLARYFSPGMVEQFAKDPSAGALSVQRREMSFVFTDLAGFTSLIEKSNPNEIVPLLNEYFDGLMDIAFRYGGTIEKVVGDGINVFFGAPDPDDNHAEHALGCAIAMDRFSAKFARQYRATGVPVGETRIGVNTGNVLVGNFGSNRFLHYTAHGDAVNTTARLQSANRLLGTRICASESTMNQNPAVRKLPIGELMLKGKSIPVKVYCPVDESLDDECIAGYEKAYAALEDEKPEAEALFQQLLDRYPDLELVAFHCRRLRRGEHGVQVSIH